MTTRTRVLFAIPSLDRNGPDRVMFELLCALDRARFTPALLTTSHEGYYFERLPEDVATTVIRGGNGRSRRYPVVEAVRVVRALCPDIVFTTTRMNLTMGLVRRAFPRRTRFIARQANDFSMDFTRLVSTSIAKHRIARRLAVMALRNADAIVCQSDGMRRDLAAVLGRRARLTTIFNPIDVAAVRDAVSSSALQLPGNPALVSTGRLTAQKGYDVLLDAIARVRASFPDIHVSVFGDGEERERLLLQRARLGLDRHVSFLGFRQDVLMSVARADLFILASRYEGFPNAALEALACGTPVVLTDCAGANADIVKAGFNGEIATAVAAAAVAVALERAIQRRNTYDRSSISLDTERRFGAQRIVRQYETLFSSVVEAQPS